MKKELDVVAVKEPKEEVKLPKPEEVSRELVLELQLNNAKADIIALKKANLAQVKTITDLRTELSTYEEKEYLAQVENFKIANKITDKTVLNQDATGKWIKTENKS